MKTKILIFVFILLSALACKKPAVEVDPNFVGRWLENDYCDMELTISPDGHASYVNRHQETDCDRAKASGKAKIKEHQFVIRRNRWFIDQYPTIIDTLIIPSWYYDREPPNPREKSSMIMILHGDTLYKVLE